jgi:hypothetical protein
VNLREEKWQERRENYIMMSFVMHSLQNNMRAIKARRMRRKEVMKAWKR